MVQRVRGMIDHETVLVDPNAWAIDSIRYDYYNGGHITMTQTFREVGGYSMLAEQNAEIAIPYAQGGRARHLRRLQDERRRRRLRVHEEEQMISTGQRSHAGVEETRSQDPRRGARAVRAQRHARDDDPRGRRTRRRQRGDAVPPLRLQAGAARRDARASVRDRRRCARCSRRCPGLDLAADLRTIAYYVVDHMLAKRAMMCVSLAEDAASIDDSPEWRGPAQILADLAAYFTAKAEAGAAPRRAGASRRAISWACCSRTSSDASSGTAPSPTAPPLDAMVDVFLHGVSA